MDGLESLLYDGGLAQQIGADAAAVLSRADVLPFKVVGRADEYVVFKVGNVLSMQAITERCDQEEAIKRAAVIAARLQDRVH